MRHDQLLHLQISGKIDTLHFDSQTLKGKKIANSSSSLLPFLHPLCVMHQFLYLNQKVVPVEHRLQCVCDEWYSPFSH